MNQLGIDTQSWHFRFLNWCDPSVKYNCQDLCTYVRSVIFNMIMLSMAVLLFGSAVLVLVGGTIAWIAACITTWTFIMPEAEPIVFFVIMLGALMATCSYHISRKWNQLSDSESSVVGLAYRSWKEQFCVKINYD